MKRRVAAYYGGYACHDACHDPRHDPRHLGRLAHARQLRSCWMCGNPHRRPGEPTLQERRAADGDRVA